MPKNELITGDTKYELTKAYIAGALAMRAMRPWTCNPHRNGTMAADDWDYGHVNESAGVHVKDGVDIITAEPTGAVFYVEEIVEA